MKTYEDNIKRDAKSKALDSAINNLLYHNGILDEFKIHCAILMPSFTCMDIEKLNPYFDENTKLICVENFEYTTDKNAENKYKINIESHVKNMKKENIYYHFGSLETLQLGAALYYLNEKFVDFIFFDLCGEWKYNHSYWLWQNRCFIKENSYQMYTISLSSSIRSRCCYFPEMDEIIGYKSSIIENVYARKRNNITEYIKKSVDYWNFIIHHNLNTSINEIDNNIPVIVYNGGKDEKTKMAIFTNQYIKDRATEYRWDYNMSFLKDAPNSYIEKIDKYGNIFETDKKINRSYKYNYKNGDYKLFGNMPYNMNDCNFDVLMKHLIYSKDHRRFENNKIFDKMHVVSKSNFPPEIYKKTHRHCYLDYRRCENVFDLLILDKEIFFEDNIYKFIRENNKIKLLIKTDENEFDLYNNRK